MSEKNETLDRILKIAINKNINTVEELVNHIKVELNMPQKEAIKYIIELENEGKIHLTSEYKTPEDFRAFIRSSHALWFRVTIVISIATMISVFTISENATLLIYIRYLLGSISIIFLPGYTLIKTVFPTREMDDIERFTLSIGTSLVLIPLMGLLLNYTPWGIQLIPITLSMLFLTVIFSISGLIREYQV